MGKAGTAEKWAQRNGGKEEQRNSGTVGTEEQIAIKLVDKALLTTVVMRGVFASVTLVSSAIFLLVNTWRS